MGEEPPRGIPLNQPQAVVMLRTLPLLLISLLSQGCVSHWRGKEIEADIVALQGQMEQSTENQRKLREQQQANLQAFSEQISVVENRLVKAIEQLRTGSADTGLVIEDLRRTLNEANGKMAELKEKLKQQGEAPIGVVAPGPNAVPLPNDAAELYRYGWERKNANDCDEAIRALATFVRKFPKNGRADNALFLQAQCLFERGQNAPSIRALQTILQKYQRGDKVDDSLVLMHDNFVAMRRCRDAMPFLETLINDYPNSNQVPAAQKKLKRTKRSCK